jgi:hypothetical protein
VAAHVAARDRQYALEIQVDRLETPEASTAKKGEFATRPIIPLRRHD